MSWEVLEKKKTKILRDLDCCLHLGSHARDEVLSTLKTM
jgi:hypothetical protein